MIIQTSSVTVTEQDIANLESIVGHPIPEPYRSFLKETNGGQIAAGPYCYYFTSHRGEDGSFVRYFLRLMPEDAIGTISDLLCDQGYWYPPAMLPIAQDGFGNALLLGLATPYLGEIFFWQHDYDGDEDNPWDGTSWVAESFDGFLNKLFDDASSND